MKAVSAVLLEAVEADDVLMSQAGQAVGLRLKTPDEVPVLGQVLTQYLDRDRVVAAGVEGMVNLRHAAAAKWFFDAVASLEDTVSQSRHRISTPSGGYGQATSIKSTRARSSLNLRNWTSGELSVRMFVPVSSTTLRL